jgi:enoyl-[acyl-carrier protein] reductase I
MKEFQDKNEWALILGGSSGLGLATAKKLAKHGMNICIVHRNSRAQQTQIEAEFQQITAEGVDFASYNTDGLHPEKRAALIQDLKDELEGGKIKTFVHSVAKGNLKPMTRTERSRSVDDGSTLKSDDFQLTIQAMGISLYDWVKELFDADVFAEDARVISFTSEGNTKAWKHYAAVSAAKVTLEAITRNIALEFAPYGIRANCIQAGVTDTQSLRMIPGSEQLKEHSKQRNPFQRLTTPDDVANVVYLLSKDEASWINGTIIKVDGGESLS